MDQIYYRKLDSVLKLDSPEFGTAILIQDKNKHFILTARHVLCDTNLIDSEQLAHMIILVENDTLLNQPTKNRVDQFGNVDLIDTTGNIFLMNFSAGTKTDLPYILSSIKEDIGVISLDEDSEGRLFYKSLVARGYRFMDIKVLDSVFNPRKYKKIFALGFPRTSFIFIKGTYSFVESSYISVPVVTRGYFEGEYPNSPAFFDARIFTYHGFSGGPVISNGRLIGLVHGGEGTEVLLTGEANAFKYVFINQSYFIKSSIAYKWIKQLEKKDEYIRKWPNR